MPIRLPYNLATLDLSSYPQDAQGNRLVPISILQQILNTLASAINVSESPPSNPQDGTLWINTSDGKWYIWYNNQWNVCPFAINATNATNATNADNANNADKVDGFHASQTPGPNLIPVADSSGKIAGDWYVAGQSLAKNGYMKLSNRLIIQWGAISLTVGTDASITFPISFPNSVFMIVISDSINDADFVSRVKNLTNSGFIFHWDAIYSANGNGTSTTGYWIAIGY